MKIRLNTYDIYLYSSVFDSLRENCKDYYIDITNKYLKKVGLLYKNVVVDKNDDSIYIDIEISENDLQKYKSDSYTLRYNNYDYFTFLETFYNIYEINIDSVIWIKQFVVYNLYKAKNTIESNISR